MPHFCLLKKNTSFLKDFISIDRLKKAKQIKKIIKKTKLEIVFHKTKKVDILSHKVLKTVCLGFYNNKLLG